MEKLKEGFYYHIYNRGINKTDLFLKEEDFWFFLQKYFYYTHLSLKTYAYCLLRNHFHLLLKVRKTEEQAKLFKQITTSGIKSSTEGLPYGCAFKEFKAQNPSRQLAHHFNSYTKNFNGWYNRTGRLFEQPFKRKKIDNKRYLTHILCYIHRNPIHHGITDEYETYEYSSYRTYVGKTAHPLTISKDEALDWFGCTRYFVEAHHDIKNCLPEKLLLDS